MSYLPPMIAAALLALSPLAAAGAPHLGERPEAPQGIAPQLGWDESVFASVIPPRLPAHGLTEASRRAAAGAHQDVPWLCAASIAAGGVEELPCRLLSAASLLELRDHREAEALLRPARGRLGILEPWGALFLAEAIVGAVRGVQPARREGSADDSEAPAQDPSALSKTDDYESAASERLQEALALLEEAGSADPSGPLGARARLLQGMVQLQSGDPHGALRTLGSLRKVRGVDPLRLRLALAEATLATGNTKGAIGIYQELWRESAGLPAADEAARRLDAFTRRGIPVPDATLAERLERIEKLLSRGKARLAYDELSTLHPGPMLPAERLALLRARALSDQERKEEAEALLAPYLEEDAPFDSDILTLGARLAMRRGATDLAVRRLDRVAASTGGRTQAEAAFLAAFFIYDEGRFPEAEVRFRAFLRAHAPHRLDETRWYIAWSLFKQERYLDAAADLASLIARSPQSPLVPQASYWRARALALGGEPEGAQAALQDVVRRWPADWYGILAAERLEAAEAAQAPASGDHAATSKPREERETPPLAEEGEDPARREPVGGGGSARSSAAAAVLAEADGAAEAEGEQAPPGSLDHGRDPRGDQPGLLLAARGGGDGFLRAEALYACGLPRLAGLELDTALASRQPPGSSGLGYYARLAARSGDPYRAYQLGMFRLGGRGGAPELAYPRAFDHAVADAARKNGVDPNLIWAIMRQESGFRPAIRSQADAVGLMQILPITAERLGALLALQPGLGERLEDPWINISLGSYYLAALLERFGGSAALAAAAYNAGPQAVARWLEDPSRRDLPLDEFVDSIPFRETRSYVKLVIANLYAYRQIHGTGASAPLELSLPAPAPGIDF